MNWLTQMIRVFSPPSADVLAMEELEDARRSLLGALSAREYASAMCAYHTDRVGRLTKTVNAGAQK